MLHDPGSPPRTVRFPGRRPRQIPTLLAVHESLRRNVINWRELEREFVRQLRRFPWRHSFFESTSRWSERKAFAVELRRGDRIECRSPSQLAFLMYSVYAAEMLFGLERLAPFVHELAEVSGYVFDRLSSEYSSRDFETGAIGGVPSPKEAILYLVARKQKPERVIETGVAQGVSSVFLLEAIRQNKTGRLTSIDLPNYRPEGRNYVSEPATHDGTYVKRRLGIGWLVPPPLRANWSLLHGASREILPGLRPTDLDLFYHDSEHSYENMRFEYEWALTHLRAGGILASDDIDWNRAFRETVREHGHRLDLLIGHRFGLATTNPNLERPASTRGPSAGSEAAADGKTKSVLNRRPLVGNGSLR